MWLRLPRRPEGLLAMTGAIRPKITSGPLVPRNDASWPRHCEERSDEAILWRPTMPSLRGGLQADEAIFRLTAIASLRGA